MSNQTVFSTGNLVASRTVSPVSATVVNGGNPDSYPSSVSTPSLIAGGTTPVLLSENATSPQQMGYVVLDLGQVFYISSITVQNAYNLTSAPGIAVYGATTSGLYPGQAGTSVIAGSSLTGTPQNVTLTPLAPVSARYLLITAGGTGNTYTISLTGISSVVAQVTFGVMQDIKFDAAWTRMELYDAPQNSIQPIDCADHEGKFTIECTNAEFFADKLQWLASAVLSGGSDTQNGSVPDTIATLGNSLQLPYFSVFCSLQTTAGKAVQLTATRCKAQGGSVPFRLTDFAMPNFKVECYPDANNGYAVATIGAQN